jgi:hypothetical protein
LCLISEISAVYSTVFSFYSFGSSSEILGFSGSFLNLFWTVSFGVVDYGVSV